MKNFCKIIFIFFVLSLNAEAQPVTWQRTYNYNGQRAAGRDVVQTFDGGYIICGAVLGPVRIYLIKLNYLGIKEWENVISDSSGNYLYANSIQQTPDSGYVMTGRKGISLAIIKTDKSGNPIWQKKYNSLGGESTGITIKITSDGGYIACGYIYVAPLSPSCVFKTDDSGNLQWEKIYLDSSSTYSEASDILEYSDHYYLAGVSTHYGYLRKLDNLGNQIWKLNFPSLMLSPKVEKILSNRLIIGGLGYPFGIMFAKVDTTGNILENKVIPTNTPEFYFYSMCLNSSQQIVVGGKEHDPPKIGYSSFAAVVIDTNGNFIKEKILESPKNVENAPYAVKATIDNGYIFVGDTEYNPGVNNEDVGSILAAKTDSNLDTTPVVNILNINNTIIRDFILFQNYPNPFNPKTKINYQINVEGYVNIIVTNNLGKEIESLINQRKTAGKYSILFEASKLSSGIYFYSLFVNGFQVDCKKMIVLK